MAEIAGLFFSNAERLQEDSKLLNENGRTASSIMLAVFALEELGKALIQSWGVKNQASKREYPTHIEKQTAVFALLAGQELWNDREGFVRAAKDGTLNFLDAGPYSFQFAQARAGFFDDLRMALTYADAEPKMPHEIHDVIDAELVRELHDFFNKAVQAVADPDAMDMAAILYLKELLSGIC